MSEKVRKAQVADGARGALGGNHWKAHDVLKNTTLPQDEIIRFVYLTEGRNLTADIAIAKDHIPLHVHKVHDELIYVLEGTGKFRVAEVFHSVGPGSIIYIPENAVHGGPLDGELRILAVYSPKFEVRNPDRIFVDEHGNPVQDD